MARKTISGADWKRFYSDPAFWPDGVWHDDTEIMINGEPDNDADLSAVADDAVIEIRAGYVLDDKQKDLGSLSKYYQKWEKAQSTTRLVVEVPKDQLDLLRAQLPTFNAKVIG